MNTLLQTTYQFHTTSPLTIPQFHILSKTPPNLLLPHFLQTFQTPSPHKIPLSPPQLTYLSSIITHNPTPINTPTFITYNTIITNSLTFHILNKSLHFKYNTQKPTILQPSLNKFIPPSQFTIIPYYPQKHQSHITHILTTFQLHFQSSQQPHNPNTHTKKILKPLLTHPQTISHITHKILNSFHYTSTFTKTKTLYQFLFLPTFINSPTFTHINNLHPKSFKLLQNNYLPLIIHSLLTHTNTTLTTHIYFFTPTPTIHPLLYFHQFFTNSQPLLKPLNTTPNSSTNKHQYQLLKHNLLTSYNKPFNKNPPYSIFPIKNPPKSHIPTHFITSFLSINPLTHFTNLLPNSTHNPPSPLPTTTYTHHITPIPHHYFPLLSPYYPYHPISNQIIPFNHHTNPIHHSHHIQHLNPTPQPTIPYPPSNPIISHHLLHYLSSYINTPI
ncbi:hypothetical protein ACRFB9_28155 [Klebsiella pneumoniae]